MTPELSFHHFGVACRDLDREAAAYQQLGYVAEHDDFVDPIQGVKGRFLIGGGPRLELLVALEGSAVLDPWLRNRTRIYHQAYETSDLKASWDTLLNSGARTVVEPVPAVAFAGRDICFLMLRNLSLIELIQTAT
jgi:methylmalonyl-CoA/ethylmalonyl-CoA epimerase